MGKLAKRPVTPTQTPGSRIKAPKIGGVSRARLSGQKMSEGAGKRGKARQQRQQTMAIMRQMLGRIKPGKSAEPLSAGGTLAARASLRRARAKAGPGASPAQRGAVKRAGTYLKASKERNRAVVKGATSRGTVGKPKGLKQGAVTSSIMNKDRATIKAASVGIDRAQRRSRQLASAQREIDRKRANPIGGKAFRGQATKRLNREQRKLDKSMGKVVSAIELNYKPKRTKAEARLAQMSRATRATSGLRVPRQRTVYQRNVFGGSEASYNR